MRKAWRLSVVLLGGLSLVFAALPAATHASDSKESPKPWFSAETRMLKSDKADRSDRSLTEARKLLEDVLASEDFGVYLAYDSVQEGYEAFKQQEPKVGQLMSHPAGVAALVELYQQSTLAQVDSSDEFSTIRFGLLELLLSQEEVLASVPRATRGEIATTAATIWENKSHYRNGEFFGHGGSALVVYRALKIDEGSLPSGGKLSREEREFLRSGRIVELEEGGATRPSDNLTARLDSAYPDRAK